MCVRKNGIKYLIQLLGNIRRPSSVIYYVHINTTFYIYKILSLLERQTLKCVHLNLQNFLKSPDLLLVVITSFTW